MNGTPSSARMTAGEKASKQLIAYGLLTALMTVAAWAYSAFFEDLTPVRDILIPLSFLGLGMLIKYGDQAFDAGTYSRTNTLILAVPGGLWMGSLIAVDAGSATIFTGLLIALLIAGKYDNAAFKLGFVVAIAIGAAAFLTGYGSLNLAGVVVVLLAGMVDEFANDLPGVENGRSLKAVLFRNRPFLKVAVLVLCIATILPSYTYFFAFLAFDFGYSMVEAMSMSRGAVAVG
jgi:hypothetical protein